MNVTGEARGFSLPEALRELLDQPPTLAAVTHPHTGPAIQDWRHQMSRSVTTPELSDRRQEPIAAPRNCRDEPRRAQVGLEPRT